MKTNILALTAILVFTVSVNAQKQMSDRDVDGLKGVVKIVEEEKSNFSHKSGEWVESQRMCSSAIEYDKEGSRLKRDSCDYRGKPFQKEVYGFLDGDKIVKEEIFPDDSAPPAPKSLNDDKPRDKRYSFKFKYKYDSKGRRIQEEWFSNTGSLWIRDVRTYDDKGNEIEWYRYSSNGELNMKSISKFDDKGNEVEVTYISVAGKSPDSTYSYSYEFDSRGNWIKRITKKLVNQNNKSEFQLYQTHYRKITYF